MPQLTEEVVIQRLTAAALIIGGVLTLMSVIILLQLGIPASVTEIISIYSTYDVLTKLGMICRAIGIWSLVLGFANVHHFIGFGAGAAWGRLGFYSLIMGASALTVATGIVIGAVEVSTVWLVEPMEEIIEVSGSLVIISQNSFELASIIIWAALIFVGIAWTRTIVYPKWSSWPLLFIGIALLILSLLQIFIDATQTFNSITTAVTGLLGIWALIAGIWLTRRAW